MKSLNVRGRQISESDIEEIQSLIGSNPGMGRTELSQVLCKTWGWFQANGRLKDMACREVLRRLEAEGMVKLPPSKRKLKRELKAKKELIFEIDTTALRGRLGEVTPIEFRQIRTSAERILYRTLLDSYHYLGYTSPVGSYLHYIIYSGIRPIGCIGWGSGAWNVACRESYIGWSKAQRLRGLRFIVNNTRFLLAPWVRVPCLASYVLGSQTRQIAREWKEKYGFGLLLAETFVGEQYAGTCYRAANWQYAGETTGRGKYGDTKVERHKKKVFLYPLSAHYRELLCDNG